MDNVRQHPCCFIGIVECKDCENGYITVNNNRQLCKICKGRRVVEYAFPHKLYPIYSAFRENPYFKCEKCNESFSDEFQEFYEPRRLIQYEGEYFVSLYR